jgi:hypothetical protein
LLSFLPQTPADGSIALQTRAILVARIVINQMPYGGGP